MGFIRDIKFLFKKLQFNFTKNKDVKAYIDNIYKDILEPYIETLSLQNKAYPKNLKEYRELSKKTDSLISRFEKNELKQEILSEINTNYQDVIDKTNFYDTSGYLNTIRNENANFDTTGTGYNINNVTFFEKMVEKDSHINGAVWSLIDSVTSRQWEIIPATDSKRGMEIANFVSKVFNEVIPDFKNVIETCTKAVITGYSVQEIMWDNKQGNLVPTSIEYRDPLNFSFDNKGNMYLDTVGGMPDKNTKPLPKNKFLVYSFRGNKLNPYGESLIGEKVFWLYYFKRIVWRFRLRFLERFGTPIMIHKYQTERDRIMMYEALKYMASKGAIQIPNDSSVEPVEVMRDTEDFQNTIADLNKELEIAIISQNATMSRENGGSYASDYIRQDQFYNRVVSILQSLESLFYNQLIKPIVTLNYPQEKSYPLFKFSKSDDVLKMKEVERDLMLVRQNFPIPIAHILRKLNIPLPPDIDINSTTAPYYDTHGNVHGGLPPEIRHQIRQTVADPRLKDVDNYDYETDEPFDGKIEGEQDPDKKRQQEREKIKRDKSKGAPAENKGKQDYDNKNPKNAKK